MSRNADALIAVLIEAAQRYVDHQEDDLGKPVLKREFFGGLPGISSRPSRRWRPAKRTRPRSWTAC
jgi:hypothetical protein